MMKQNMGSTVIISNQNDTCLSLRYSINLEFLYMEGGSQKNLTFSEW